MIPLDSVKLPRRRSYSLKQLLQDVMMIHPSPGVLQRLGSEVIYSEWSFAQNGLGADHPVTRGLAKVLSFMEEEYERQLLEGELSAPTDTPRAALTTLLKSLPKETRDYKLLRDPAYIHQVLTEVLEERKRELERCRQIEAGLRREVKENPDDPDIYNQLRIVLWLMGEYEDASKTFERAKELGWSPEKSALVAL